VGSDRIDGSRETIHLLAVRRHGRQSQIHPVAHKINKHRLSQWGGTTRNCVDLVMVLRFELPGASESLPSRCSM
jgi:hypothetical protein